MSFWHMGLCVPPHKYCSIEISVRDWLVSVAKCTLQPVLFNPIPQDGIPKERSKVKYKVNSDMAHPLNMACSF